MRLGNPTTFEFGKPRRVLWIVELDPDRRVPVKGLDRVPVRPNPWVIPLQAHRQHAPAVHIPAGQAHQLQFRPMQNGGTEASIYARTCSAPDRGGGPSNRRSLYRVLYLHRSLYMGEGPSNPGSAASTISACFVISSSDDIGWAFAHNCLALDQS